MGFERTCHGNQIVTGLAAFFTCAINRLHPGHGRFPEGQRAGFIECHHFTAGQTFKENASLEDHAGSGSTGETADHRDGCTDDQGARAAD